MVKINDSYTLCTRIKHIYDACSSIENVKYLFVGIKPFEYFSKHRPLSNNRRRRRLEKRWHTRVRRGDFFTRRKNRGSPRDSTPSKQRRLCYVRRGRGMAAARRRGYARKMISPVCSSTGMADVRVTRSIRCNACDSVGKTESGRRPLSRGHGERRAPAKRFWHDRGRADGYQPADVSTTMPRVSGQRRLRKQQRNNVGLIKTNTPRTLATLYVRVAVGTYR